MRNAKRALLFLPQRGRMSAQLTGEGEDPSAQRYRSELQMASFSLITRFAGASPAGGSTAPQFLHKKRDRKTPLVLLPPSLPERFPVFQPVAPLVCIFFGVHFPKSRPDPILLPESFCLPLRLRRARPLSGHSSGPYSLFRLFLYRRHKKWRITPAAFCTLSVCSPLFAVKCFLRRKHAAHGLPCKGRWLSRLRRSRRGLSSVKADPWHTGQTSGGKSSRCPSSGPRL